MENIEKFMELSAQREWEDGVPMIDQMSAKEAVQYEEISLQIQSAQIVGLIESKRERDLWAISEMARQATDISSNEIDIESLSEKQIIYIALMSAAEELIPIDEADFSEIPEQAPCTIENALFAGAIRARESASSVYGWEEAAKDALALRKKYGGDNFDKSAMSSEDRVRLERDIAPIVALVNERLGLGEMLLRLALLEKMSIVRYRSMQLDHYDAPGDIEYMGTNWERMVEQNRFSETEMLAARVLSQLDESVPPRIVEDWAPFVERQTEKADDYRN